jgi:hypothetical protein
MVGSSWRRFGRPPPGSGDGLADKYDELLDQLGLVLTEDSTELVAQPTGELAEHLLWINTELGQEIGMLIRVDVIGQLIRRLLRLSC